MKQKGPVNANAELTLRKKLNQANNKKTDSKKKNDATAKKKSKKKKGKKDTRRKDDDDQPDDDGADKEEDQEHEEAQEEEHDDTAKANKDNKPKASSEVSKSKPKKQFSLGEAQRLSKQKKKVEERGAMKRPASAAVVAPLTRMTGKQEQKRQRDQEEEEEEEEEEKQEEVQEPRSKIRSRYVSQAYHRRFDSLKPKLKDGYVRDTKAWNDRMEMAKAKAREAHHAAAVQFDKENPKEQPPQKKKKNDKKDKRNKRSNAAEEGGGCETDYGSEPWDAD